MTRDRPRSDRRRRELGSRKRLAAAVCATLACAAVACVSAGPGGWDVAAAATSSSAGELADLQAIAELRPFPALAAAPDPSSLPGSGLAAFPSDVELLACRFDLDRSIEVVIEVAPERVEWAEASVRSLLGAIAGLRFSTRLVTDPDDHVDPVLAEPLAKGQGSARDARRGEIRITDYHGPSEKGPRGVGDTLVACAGESGEGVRRGEIVRAEIRMRASVRDVIDEVQMLDAERWAGALLHELGHALGFQGHPRAGDSILVLEHDRLRRAGARALAGDVQADPKLEALYRLEIGRPLGRRPLSASSQSWTRAIERRRSEAGDMVGPARANVGDRDAQLVWQDTAGLRLRLVFPSWREQLARGKPLIAMPSRVTRRRLALH